VIDDLSIEDFILQVKAEAGRARTEDEFSHKFLTLFEEHLTTRGLKPQIRMEERIVSGRGDARIGFVVFEFELPHRLDIERERKKTLGELRNHLLEYASKGFQSDSLLGIATDGISLALLKYDHQSGDFVTVDEYERPINPTKSYYQFEKSALILERTIVGIEKRELSPENLLEEFGPGSELCKRLVPNLLRTMEASKHRMVEVLFKQWEILFSLSAGKLASGDIGEVLQSYGLNKHDISSGDGVRRFLFIIQTYYSLILKFFALQIADQLRLFGVVSLLSQIREDPMRGLKSAESRFSELALNVVEGDVFAWFEHEYTEELENSLSSLANRVAQYDVRGVRSDVLKRVYQRLIPTKIRRSLGEYYTRDQVANIILDEVGYVGEGRVLDPSCGSGTFLVLAIDRMKRRHSHEDPNKILTRVLDSIYGFDVNPIAVMTARLNYLLAIEDLLEQTKRGVSIPVFLCDSIVFPKFSEDITVGGMVFSIDVANPIGEFRIPSVEDPTKLLRLLEQSSKQETASFLEHVKRELGEDITLKYKQTLTVLHQKIQQLDRDELNSIWCGLIENFFAPLLAGKFQFVVGNPPWVIPERMTKQYSTRLLQIVKQSGFLEIYDPHFKSASHFFWSSGKGFVACLPFVALALERYAENGGYVAFLMTSSLLKLLNAGGFRKKMLEYRLEKILDFTLYTKVHERATCWAFVPIIKNEKHVPEKIEYTFYTPRKLNQ